MRFPGSERRALRRDRLSGIVRFSERRSSSALGRIRAGLDIRAVLDQKLDGRRMAFVRGPHQRGGSAQGFLRIHVRAVVEQHLDRIDIAGARRRHERSSSQREMLVGIGSGFEQRRDDGGISVDAGQPQRRGALAVRGLRIRAGVKQQVHHLFIGPEHRPVKRGRAIGLGRIHVGVLLDQLLHGRLVAAHDRVRNLGGVRRRQRAATDSNSNATLASRRCVSCDSLYRFSRRPVLSPMLSW